MAHDSDRAGFVYGSSAAKAADVPGFFAPKGQPQISPGQRPGCRDNEVPVALKGRNKERTEAVSPACCAPSGLEFSRRSRPRAALRGERRSALPWADLWLPLRGEYLSSAMRRLSTGLSCYSPSSQKAKPTLDFARLPISSVNPNFASGEPRPPNREFH